MKIYLFPLCVLMLALILSGCSTHTAAVVTKKQIANPTVGFDGYQVPIPLGYKVYDTFEHAGKNPYGDLLNKVTQSVLQYEGEILDQITMVEARRAITFSVQELVLLFSISTVSDEVIKNVLQQEVARIRGKAFQVKNRGVFEITEGVKLNDRKQVGFCHGEVSLGDNVYSLYVFIVPGKLKEFYYFHGLCLPKDAKKVENDIRFMVKHLQF